MALILTAYDLVIRVDALPGGVESFGRAVPNSTFCTDGRIARASFMVEGDRGRFACTENQELRRTVGRCVAEVDARFATGGR
jgi:hypothetical protein